jgi:glucose/arabinose dehydrogenase
VVYNYNNGNAYNEKVVRFQYKNNTLASPLVLIQNIAAANIHSGSRLWITGGPDPKLLISTGDANNSSSAQDINSANGKILRLNLDGSIPSDNPVSGNPYWSYGHRNPQGLVIADNIIYTSEHGPNVEDEINIIEKGRNYGWPEVNGPCNGSETSFCSSNNIKEPIWSSGGSTIATSGLDHYNKDLISVWKNSLLMATLKDATLYQFKLNSDGRSVASTTKYFKGKWGRLRDICISPEGRVYICTSNGGNTDLLLEISNPEE